MGIWNGNKALLDSPIRLKYRSNNLNLFHFVEKRLFSIGTIVSAIGFALILIDHFFSDVLGTVISNIFMFIGIVLAIAGVAMRQLWFHRQNK